MHIGERSEVCVVSHTVSLSICIMIDGATCSPRCIPQSALERNIELLAQAVESDIAKHKDFFVSTLFLAIEIMPGKIPIYGALLGLLNLQNHNFAVDFVAVGGDVNNLLLGSES